MSDIYAENISVAYDDKVIINDLSVTIAKQKITTIIGANGCGKSTLLKALTRIHALKAGQVFVDGEAIAHLPTKEIAKKLALLPQMLEATEGISVYELVSYGRFPHQNYLGSLSDTDKEKINWAMEITKVVEFANEKVDSLSGGCLDCYGFSSRHRYYFFRRANNLSRYEPPAGNLGITPKT